MRFDLTVNEFTRDLWAERKLDVFGETFWRPYVHVRDAARAVALVLASPLDKVAGRVFNAGHSDENYRKLDLVEIITGQLGRGDVEYVSRTEDPRDYKVSFERIKDELGFEPSAPRADRHRGARRRARGGALRRSVLAPLLQHRLMSDAPLIPLFDVKLEQHHLDAVSDTLRSGWLTMGPRTAGVRGRPSRSTWAASTRSRSPTARRRCTSPTWRPASAPATRWSSRRSRSWPPPRPRATAAPSRSSPT